MKYLFAICFSLICKSSYNQTILTILPDSTVKFFTDQELKFHTDRCTEGVKLLIDDSSGTVIVETHIKNCRRNGVYRRFYENNMIMELGNYLNDKAEGVFYYWDENGFLKRKELWEKNKLKKTISFTVPVSAKRSKKGTVSN